MALQSAKNVQVRFLEESVYNTPPGDAGAELLRFTPSAGLNLKSATIRSNEQRADALSTMGRNGSNTVDGSFSAEVSVGSHDTMYEAAMRSTWTAPLVIADGDTNAPANITTLADGIVGDTGDFRLAGVRVGDVWRLANQDTSTGNNNRNLTVKAVAALKITTYETLIVNAVADPDYTLTRGKKLTNPTAGPTKRTFYVEQYYKDVNASQVFGGVRFTSMKFTGTPDGMATVEFSVLGASMDTLKGSNAPYYDAPTIYNSDPLVFADARIYVGGEQVLNATGFELTYTINASLTPVVGTRTSPDVFDNDASLTGSFTALRANLDKVEAFVDETEFSLLVLLTEPRAEPKPFFALFVPRCKYTGVDASLGGDSGMAETLPFQTGTQLADAVLGLDQTLLTIITSV